MTTMMESMKKRARVIYNLRPWLSYLYIVMLTLLSSLNVQAEVKVEENVSSWMNWPSQRLGQYSLLEVERYKVPPVGEMFGKDPKVLLRGWDSPRGYGAKNRGVTHPATFLIRYHMGNLQPLEEILSELEVPFSNWDSTETDRFWGQAVPKLPEMSKEKEIDCPFCSKKFKGWVMSSQNSEPRYKTRCCGLKIGASGELPKKVLAKHPKTVVETASFGTEKKAIHKIPVGEDYYIHELEIAACQWAKVKSVISPLIFAAIAKKDKSARSQLVAITQTMVKNYFHASPWFINKRGDDFLRNHDLPLKLSFKFRKEADQPVTKEIGDLYYQKRLDSNSITKKTNLYKLVRDDLKTMALIAECFGAIFDDLNPQEQKQSIAFMQGAFKTIRTSGNRGGNFGGYTLPPLLSIAIGSQDQELFERMLKDYYKLMMNRYYPDGVSIEGAYNYGEMMSWAIKDGMAERFGSPFAKDLFHTRPILKKVKDLTPFPIRTLWNIESQSGDEHSGFFRSGRINGSEHPRYKETEDSLLLPTYGEVVLRAGKEGQRLEAIMDFKDNVLHSQYSRMNLQVFYEGVSLMPDFGYNARSQLYKGNYKALQGKSPFVIGRHRPWFQSSALAHVNATVDGHIGDDPMSSIESYMANKNQALKSIKVTIPKEEMARFDGDIQHITRKISMVSLPNERPIVVSTYYMKGGYRHDNFWHIPSTQIEMGVPGSRLSEKNLAEFDDQHSTPKLDAETHKILKSRTFALIAKSRNQLEKKRFKQPENVIDVGSFGRSGEQVKSLTGYKVKAGKFWCDQTEIFPKQYVNFREPEEHLKRKYHLNVWNAYDGNDAKTHYIKGVGPWPGIASGVIAYTDGMQYFNLKRQSEQNDLVSTFYNVYDFGIEAEKPTLREVLLHKNDEPSGYQEACLSFSTQGGDRAYLFSQYDVKAQYKSEALQAEFAGDTLYFNEKNAEISALASRQFRFKGWSLSMSPTQVFTLAGVKADLTGYPNESVLIAKARDPQASYGELEGALVNVKHQCNPVQQSSFFVDKIYNIDEQLKGIKLKDNPSFINFYSEVKKINGPRDISIHVSYRLNPKGNMNLKSYIYFPRTKFLAQIEENVGLDGSAGWSGKSFVLDRDLPKEVQVQDKFVVYSMNVGDMITVQNHFSCKRKGNVFTFRCTSPIELKVPFAVSGSVRGGLKLKQMSEGTMITAPSGTYQLNLQ